MKTATTKPTATLGLDYAWESSGRGYRRYRLLRNGKPTGYGFAHCGHPTALYPYMVQTPTEQAVHPCGYAFHTVEDAKLACEGLIDGSRVLAYNGRRHAVVPVTDLTTFRRNVEKLMLQEANSFGRRR